MVNIVSQKFFPNTQCDVWEYCAYLGSIETKGGNFDLGLWRSGNKENFSLILVDGDEYNADHSIGFICGKTIEPSVFHSSFGSSLPLRVCGVLALQHEWLQDSPFKNLDLVNKNYVLSPVDYLVSSTSNHKVRALLNNNVDWIELDIVVHEETHWKNTYRQADLEFDYDEIKLIEIGYNHCVERYRIN